MTDTAHDLAFMNSQAPHDLTVDNVVSLIRALGGGVSFPELVSHLKDAEGDYSFVLPDKNMVLWVGVSDLLVKTVHEAIQRDLITINPTSLLVYMCDGGMLQLPVAKQNRAYKKPHWLPVVFNVACKSATP